MNENDSLSEYNKIPLGHKRTNGTVCSKIYIKVKSSHASFPALILLHSNSHYKHDFPNIFAYYPYVYRDYVVCSVPAIAHTIHYWVFVTLLQL